VRAVSFQTPLELILNVQGEEWRQGEAVHGNVIVKNRGAAPISLSQFSVRLARGKLSKVRQKTAGAFEVLRTAELRLPPEITAGGEAQAEWSFQTDRNAPITDSLGSLFLLYGNAQSPEAQGNLQLSFVPEPLIAELLRTLEIQFRFVLKGTKFSKGRVEAKLSPPASRAFSTLEGLVMAFTFEGDTLLAEYAFHVKKLEATAAAVDMKKEARELEQRFTIAECIGTAGRFQHELIESRLREAIGEFESKVTL
jgi:hypothetical protein